MKYSLVALTLFGLLASTYALDEPAADAGAAEQQAAAAPELSPEEKQMEEDFSKLFADGKIPSMEEMQEHFKKLMGEDFDFDNMFGNLDGAAGEEEEKEEL